MSKLLITNGRIVTCKSKGPKCGEEMMNLGVIDNGFVAACDGVITEVGRGNGKDYADEDTKVFDAGGRLVMPGLVDSHTHIAFCGSRENEVSLKLKGVSYIEILKGGGGILSTVNETRKASIDELREKIIERLNIMLHYGTTTIEAKSGYGLNFEDEIKCLNALNVHHPIDIVKTFMGAHAVPREYENDREGYIDLINNEITPYAAKNKLAEFIDCFCEKDVFSLEESERILKRGREEGLKIKIHADEMSAFGGAELAGKLHAVSAEHLVSASDEGIDAMKRSGTIAVLLPGTSFYARLNKYARARYMIDKGLPVAIATDYNPGTCPTESLQGIMVFASMGMGMMPEEVIAASTINAAYAIDRGDKIGSLEKGKYADIVIMNVPNEKYLIYHFGINHVNTVFKKGRIVAQNKNIEEVRHG